MTEFTTTTAPVRNTDRFIILDSAFGRVEVPVRISWCWTYDGELDQVVGTALVSVPGTYIEAGDRLAITPERLMPLIRWVNPALVR